MGGEIERIRDQLRRAVHGDAWHGPSLTEALDHFRPDTAWERAGGAGHNACELALHVASWLEIVRERLEGRTVVPTPERDWPPTGDPGEARWRAATERVAAAWDDLDRTLSALPDGDLERVVPEKGYTFWFMLHGVIQHTLYHTGQLMMLARLLGAAL